MDEIFEKFPNFDEHPVSVSKSPATGSSSMRPETPDPSRTAIPTGFEDGGTALAARMEEFVRLFSSHQQRLHHFIGSLLPDGQDAEDVFQETCLVLWREFGTYQSGTNFSAWAMQIALNQVLAQRKRRSRSRLILSDEFLSAVARDISAFGDDLDRRTTALASCLTKLPPHHQELIRARYSSGTAIEEIATELHRSPDAVYRMLSRIRQSLHDCVNRTLAADNLHG